MSPGGRGGGLPRPAGRHGQAASRRAATTFLRGLSVGALVGAALAGALVLGRRGARRDERPTGGGDGSGRAVRTHEAGPPH